MVHRIRVYCLDGKVLEGVFDAQRSNDAIITIDTDGISWGLSWDMVRSASFFPEDPIPEKTPSLKSMQTSLFTAGQ